MKNKLKIIIDILFKNGDYVKTIINPVTIKEKQITPFSIIGRVIVSKEEADNMPEDILYKRACSEIIKSDLLLSLIEKIKFDINSSDDFLNNKESKIVYEVKLNAVSYK